MFVQHFTSLIGNEYKQIIGQLKPIISRKINEFHDDECTMLSDMMACFITPSNGLKAS